MNRADLELALGESWPTLIAAAGMEATDTPGNLKAAIDRAFLKLGVARADLATASVDDIYDAQSTALGDYYLLTFIQGNQSQANVSGSTSIAEPSVSESTSRDGHLNLTDLIAQAKADCTAAGVRVGPATWASPVDVPLDILEPSLCQS